MSAFHSLNITRDMVKDTYRHLGRVCRGMSCEVGVQGKRGRRRRSVMNSSVGAKRNGLVYAGLAVRKDGDFDARRLWHFLFVDVTASKDWRIVIQIKQQQQLDNTT